MNDLTQAAEAVDIDQPRQEAFFDRWSRVKREVNAGAVPPGTVEESVEVPVLPSLEILAAQGLEADFAPFMQKGVEEATKRAAIQQLFKQPVFNVMDGLDVYIEDFNIYEPLTAAELPGLAHARAMLFPEAENEQVQVGAAEQEAEMLASNAADELVIETPHSTEQEEETHGRA